MFVVGGGGTFHCVCVCMPICRAVSHYVIWSIITMLQPQKFAIKLILPLLLHFTSYEMLLDKRSHLPLGTWDFHYPEALKEMEPMSGDIYVFHNWEWRCYYWWLVGRGQGHYCMFYSTQNCFPQRRIVWAEIEVVLNVRNPALNWSRRF